MRAAWYEKNGAARDVLKVGSLPEPLPGPGEVRVRIHASGVNPSDVKARAGRPLLAPRMIPHSDGAGIVDAVGAGVAGERIGERVWTWNAAWRRSNGTAAEYVVLPQDQAVHLTDNLSFEEGACLGIPALTALRAVTMDGSVLGRTVLVTGGAGAVGAYAIQFARLYGAARIVTTISTAEKAEICRKLGADHTINYKTEDVADRIRGITNGRGVDRIIEVDAAANVEMLPNIIARDGLCVIYGSSKPEISFEFFPMILAGAAVRFFIVYEMSPEVREQTVGALQGQLASGLLRHHIAETYALDDIAAAHEAVENGKTIGNVVVSL
ncbi:NADPH:quinone reductase [Sinorhizobium arboris]|uniref:NADPH:quinone reductase n=1 Tax=Sinorhizobium arboris TaxID=76745 RepID=UPI00041DACEF|nr:NADPH:quinone reductase [Sinorhizobium arboris]